MYRACGNVVVTTAGSNAYGLAATVEYYYLGHFFSVSSSNATENSQWSQGQQCVLFNADASTNISWLAYNPAGAGGATFTYSFTLERLK